MIRVTKNENIRKMIAAPYQEGSISNYLSGKGETSFPINIALLRSYSKGN
jgi:hypothetical protein